MLRTPLTFRSDSLTLAGELSVPADSTRAAVICHPHPQYGGDMDNPIVCAVAGALQDAGYTTLRFNFRGVGGSSGEYSGGAGEADDARAAVTHLIERCGSAPVTLAGYSFGAMIALQVGAEMPPVDRLIAVAPPLAFFDLAAVAACRKPKLFVVGDRDQYCSVSQLAQQLAQVAAPQAQHIVAGADHFFAGHEHAVVDAVRAFVQERE
jgi:alpha/beta superfamily hydrolase